MAQEVSLLRRLARTRRGKFLAAAAVLVLAAAGAWIWWPREFGEAELYDGGNRFRRAELFAEAAGSFERLAAEHPDGTLVPGALLRAAECRECLGQWKRAEKLYETCLRRFPDDAAARDARARLRVLARVIRYADLVAEKDLPPAKCAEALYDMGLLVRDRLNPFAAAEILAGSADRFPRAAQAPEARHAAGRVLLGIHRLVEAREQFTKFVASHPDSRLADDAQYWVAHTYETQGRLIGGLDPDGKLLEALTDERRRTLRADLDLRRRFNPDAAPPPPPAVPSGLSAAERKARARELLGSAVKAYARVAGEHKLSDRAPEALVRIGEINARFLKDADAATEAYRQLLEKYPGTQMAVAEQCAVGQAYVRRGKLKEAERLLKVFMTSFPNHERYGDALLFMAECHRRQKEYVKALDDYQTFLSRRPGSPRAAEVREEIAWLKKYRL